MKRVVGFALFGIAIGLVIAMLLPNTCLLYTSYKDTAQELLFNKKLPSVLPYSKSQFTLTSSDTEAERMMTAMGQGKTQVSPYHMALITSAIANGGTLMKPYLVDSVTNNAGNVIEKTKPEKYKDLMLSLIHIWRYYDIVYTR